MCDFNCQNLEIFKQKFENYFKNMSTLIKNNSNQNK